MMIAMSNKCNDIKLGWAYNDVQCERYGFNLITLKENIFLPFLKKKLIHLC